MSDAYLGARTPSDSSDLLTAIAFIARMMHEESWTATLVEVTTVYGGGADSGPPSVDVQPLVNQINGLSQPTPQGSLSKIPSARIQAGTSAIICDPQVGDIGLAVFADHDITAVLATGQRSNPGSWRRFHQSDGIYVITLIGAAPTSFIQFLADGGIQITVPSGKPINVNCGTATITADNVNLGATGGQPVARVGDSVAGGVITTGSSKVKSA